MKATRIRKQCKFGMFVIHLHSVNIWAEVDGKLYDWNENATSGFPGAIQHGGNFLHGTEYRVPATSHGDWVQYPHLEHDHVVVSAGLGYGSNNYPSFTDVLAALHGDIAGWERTNPEGGKNNEWIPLTADNANE